MAFYSYEFLSQSLLFDPSLVKDDFRTVSDSELKKELEKYREHSLKHLNSEEICGDNSVLRLLGSKSFSSINNLKQAALYLDQVILPDPIFSFSVDRGNISSSMSEYLGFDKNDEINKSKLSKVIKFLWELKSLVVGHYVKLYPISYFSEGPIKHFPINYSSDQYQNSLPRELLKFYRNNVSVNSLTKIDRGFKVEEYLKLGRSIGVEFKNDSNTELQIYNLFQQEVLSMDEETRVATFKMTLPNEPPSKELFDSWVNQSINQSALGHFENLTSEIALAEKLESLFICESEFSDNLLRTHISKENKNIPENTVECLMGMELPFLTNINSEDLMNIRHNDGEAFSLFRVELEKQLRELRFEKDPLILKQKIENVQHELTEVQVKDIQAKMTGIRSGALAESGIALAGLGASVVTSGLSLIATLLVSIQGCKTYADYQSKIKTNPCYFMWKVKNS